MTKPKFTPDPPPVDTSDIKAVFAWIQRNLNRIEDWWPKDFESRIQQLELRYPNKAGTFELLCSPNMYIDGGVPTSINGLQYLAASLDNSPYAQFFDVTDPYAPVSLPITVYGSAASGAAMKTTPNRDVLALVTVTSGNLSYCQLFETTNFTQTYFVYIDSDVVVDAEISADGQYLVCGIGGSSTHKFGIINISTQSKVSNTSFPNQIGQFIAINPDSSYFVTNYYSGNTVASYYCADGTLKSAAPVTHTQTVRCGDFSPNGEYLAFGSGAFYTTPSLFPRFYVYDVASDTEIGTFDDTPDDEWGTDTGGGTQVNCCRFSPDGSILVYGMEGTAASGTVGSPPRLWAYNTTDWTRITIDTAEQLTDPPRDMSFDPTGRYLSVACDNDNKAQPVIYDTTTWTKVNLLEESATYAFQTGLAWV